MQKNTNNVALFPTSKQIHLYVPLNRKQLQILSSIYDDLTYNVAIEILKKRKFKLNTLWLSKVLNVNPFDIKVSLNKLIQLSLIRFEHSHIRVC
ncbi:hypothetical protein L3V86_01060 [Thiotrichales bacterium 19S11-10]|nr:hypothetical protein [Thiotrichales bacterium 19S11-10]